MPNLKAQDGGVWGWRCLGGRRRRRDDDRSVHRHVLEMTGRSEGPTASGQRRVWERCDGYLPSSNGQSFPPTCVVAAVTV